MAPHMCARLPGIDPDSKGVTAVSTVARNLFDWLNFRHDTRQDTRGLPLGTIQGIPTPRQALFTQGEQGPKVCACDLRSHQRIE